MNIFDDDRITTPEECIALWKKKDWLRAEVAELELEYNELQTCVKHLSNIEKHLRKSTTQLCYDLGILFNQIGRLVDTNKSHLWTQWQESVDEAETHK